ncbi:MAG TPA: cold shock and DUF1294 domain-containing protein [Galbitalea sp.]|jgi:uncharacterized membrane protein YsdA (DUF1294 family)/cold shock CspA family protein|nr:cold shock and DUF1294 domain-containing protein [Galbitalea sp.]
MAPNATRFDGAIASWNQDRGFGFIQPDGGGKQIFVHVRALPVGARTPNIGDKLSYEVERTTDGKTRARYVRLAGQRAAQTYGTVRTNILSYLPLVLFAVIYAVVEALWHPHFWVFLIYLGTSLICVLIYWADKSAAARGRWRVSESALLLLGLAGGWPGAIIAQRLFHHKTRKGSFQAAFAGSVVVNILAFVILTSPILGTLTNFTGPD